MLRKAGFSVKSQPQPFQIFPAGYLHGAELPDVLVHDLRIEEHKPAPLEPLDQMDEADFRGIRFPAEHRLAEEGAADGDAIEAAGEPALVHYRDPSETVLHETPADIDKAVLFIECEYFGCHIVADAPFDELAGMLSRSRMSLKRMVFSSHFSLGQGKNGEFFSGHHEAEAVAPQRAHAGGAVDGCGRVSSGRQRIWLPPA